eukprot:jgi/Chlat1/3129/Chrsp21S03356
MDRRVGVGVGVLVCRGNKVLVGKRKGSHGAGTYALPGGHLDFGETWAECAIREVLEETGLSISPPRFAYVTNSIMQEEAKHYVTIFMRAETVGGVDAEARVMEKDKCEEWVWSELENVPEPRFMPLQDLIDSGYTLTS